MSGGHGDAHGAKKSESFDFYHHDPDVLDLERTIGDAFEHGDLDKMLSALPPEERADALMDFQVYMNKSTRYKANINSQAVDGFSDLYTRALKYVKEKHHIAPGMSLHPEKAKDLKEDDRKKIIDDLIDFAIAQYVEKGELSAADAKERFAHVYGEGHDDKEGHHAHRTPLEEAAFKASTEEKRAQIVNDLLAEGRDPGAYKKLVASIGLSKNTLYEQMNDEHGILHKLFMSAASVGTEYGMRTKVVNHHFGNTFVNNHDLIQKKGVARASKWGEEFGHEYGLNPVLITDHERLRSETKTYHDQSVAALTNIAKNGPDQVRYVPLKPDAAAGAHPPAQ